jgi:DNA modification methylase
MEERKLTKEDIDRVRDIEGFPIAKDEDIIALSRPPYYTACPNPFIEDFIREHGTPYDEVTDDYHREPFAVDVSEGKGEPIYRAHSYHTKVPYKAIMRYLLHYTKPGDVIFDGFCGSGMLGVAADMCENADTTLKMQLSQELKEAEWGKRYAIIGDLSPIASFISACFNIKHEEPYQISSKLEQMLAICHKNSDWMYETFHIVNGHFVNDKNEHPIIGRINYVIWSDVLVCPSCSNEIVFWDVAVDRPNGRINREFSCLCCNSRLKKSDCEHAWETYYDSEIGESATIAKIVPVIINYSVGKAKYEKQPDENDIDVLNRIATWKIPWFAPTNKWPEGEKTQEPIKLGIERIHQIYIKRSLVALASIYDYCCENGLMAVLTKIVFRLTKMYRLTYQGGTWGAGGGPMNGTLYIPSLIKEINVCKQLEENNADILTIMTANKSGNNIVSLQSLTQYPQLPDNSIDYVFTDPPFGANINYSELSSIWESWLRVTTNTEYEAIINSVQHKQLPEYQKLMEKCFQEYYRVLKPGHWMTVEFHNSKNAVWNSIQEALSRVGFVIADVRVINKQQNSYNQANAQGAVKQDLVISAYKPKESFVRQFTERAGDPEMAWEFVRQHLQNVPIAPDSTGKIEVVSERQDYLLFDRMVAFHIMNGIPVPMDAHTFYAGLRERFIPRDGMLFLPDQVNEYDECRQKMELQDQQLSLFITDEKSAIIWLNAQLGKERQSYSEIQPKFLQDWHRNKFEQMPELLDMLKENFLQDEDGKWYVPDLSDKADLEKLRRKRLLKDFYDIYAKGTGRIKNARTEAIRVGFDECWKERNYSLIVKVGDRLPETVLQEDPALLMYYDNAANRM